MGYICRWYSRILVIVSDSMRHPLFVGFLQWESGAARQTQDDRQENKAMKSTRDDESDPHPEVVDLQVLISIGSD